MMEDANRTDFYELLRRRDVDVDWYELMENLSISNVGPPPPVEQKDRKDSQ